MSNAPSYHTQLSPSAAHRWMWCPGSISLSKDIPDKGSPAAMEGTQAHEIAAYILQGKNPATPEILQNCKENGWDFQQMVADIQMYINTVRVFPGKLEVEYGLNTDWLEEGGHGTSDAVVYNDKHLWILDLKYGMHPINAKENPQLLIYARSALEQLQSTAECIHVIIVQPRINHRSIYNLTRESLYRITDILQAAGRIALLQEKLPDYMRTYRPTTEGCKYCKAAGICRAYANHVLDTINNNVAVLTNEELGQLYRKLDTVKDWTKAMEDTVFSKLNEGEDVQGLTLTVGREGPRKWGDLERAAEIMKSVLGDDAFEKELISPTTASKLAKTTEGLKAVWDDIDACIVRSPGKKKITMV